MQEHLLARFAGFDGAVMAFEEWVCLLLLDALQRAGFFRAARQLHALADMRAAVSEDYSRFIAEAVDILVCAGMLSRCHACARHLRLHFQGKPTSSAIFLLDKRAAATATLRSTSCLYFIMPTINGCRVCGGDGRWPV